MSGLLFFWRIFLMNIGIGLSMGMVLDIVLAQVLALILGLVLGEFITVLMSKRRRGTRNVN